MSEKKVYAMAPEGCAEYLTAGRVYRLLGGDHSAVKVVDDDGDEIFSAWKGGGHLNGRNWTRLELTEEEAEAINNGSKVLVDASDAEGEKWVVADPQGDDEVSEIEWSPWIEHDGHKRPDDDMLVHVELVNGGGSFGLASRYIWSIDGDDLDIRRFSVPAEQYNDYMSIPTFDDGALYSHPNSEPDADECSVVADTLEYDPVDHAADVCEKRGLNPFDAAGFLESALGHMRDREATYDAPGGERSIGKTVAAFNAVTGHSVTEEQGWLFMVLLKAVRTQQGGFRADNYEDGAAYFGLQGEAAHRERG